MLNLQLARKYARAFFLVAQEQNKLTEYGEELSNIVKAINSQADLKLFITNPQVRAGAKKDILVKLFKDEVSEMTLNFLFLLADKKRESLLDEITRAYEAFSNEARGIVVADVTTAMEISQNTAKRLQDKLASVTGKTVKLRSHIEPRILGGVIVRMGDKRLDGSLLTRLDGLKKELMAN